MRPNLRDDRGAIAITVAILTVGLLALAAVVIDVGYLYAEKRQLQAAADAAALAGCWELAHDQPQSVVLATAEQYAIKNAVAPGDHLTMLKTGPATVVGSDYVKITVEKASPLFFANVFGLSTTPVRAQSVAKVQYLTGIASPVPWALPILHVTHGTAWETGGPSTDLGDEGNGHWGGEIGPVTTSGDVFVRLFNGQTYDPNNPNGVPEDIGPAARVLVQSSTSRIRDLQLGQGNVLYEPGESIDLWVKLSAPLAGGEKLRAGFGNKLPEMSPVAGSPGEYRTTLVAPGTDLIKERFDVNVVLEGQGNAANEELSPAAYVWVRRSTYPIKRIVVSPTVFSQGTPGYVEVDVEPNDYKYGVHYELKVEGGQGEMGNFMALDFGNNHHTPYWRSNDPVEYDLSSGGGSLYRDGVAGVLSTDFVVHIGDTIWTKTGGVEGPTRQGLDTRFAGDNTTWAGWDKKSYTRRLVYVPITEKVQEVTGQTALRVVMFATFFVDTVTSSQGSVVVGGYFIEYTSAPGQVGGQPPGYFSVKVPRLVKEHVDF